MTAPTIPFEVTGTLTFTCYSSHIRYKINLFQGVLLDSHDCSAAGVSVQVFSQIRIEVWFWFGLV